MNKYLCNNKAHLQAIKPIFVTHLLPIKVDRWAFVLKIN